MSLYVDIEKDFPGFHLAVQFETKEEAFAVLGESGCGKSMTLKCIAGIETPDKGRIVLNGRVLFDSEERINRLPRKRNIGYLFQQYALFPNMTVADNIGISLQRNRRKTIVSQYIKEFFLEGLENKYPSQLSGGQQQRVALARMLAASPELVLLDEPFSGLDSNLKWHLEQRIMDVWEVYGTPILFVSHNRDEVYRLCNRIGIIHKGRMEVVGTKEEIFLNPTTYAAAMITGCKNIAEIQKTKGNEFVCKDWMINVPLEQEDTKLKYNRLKSSGAKYAGIRAHDINLYHNFCDMAEQTEILLRGRVERIVESPFACTWVVRILDGMQKSKQTLCVIGEKKQVCKFKKGEEVLVGIPVKKILFLSSSN